MRHAPSTLDVGKRRRPVAADALSQLTQLSGRKRVLAADAPDGIATLRNILEPTAELVAATAMRDALELLKGKIDLMVCGIHFESSRMFDLLRLAKADPLARAKPILCYRDLSSELPPTILQSLTIACTALGAVGFVDLYSLKQEVGTINADMRFLAIVLRHLGVPEV